MTQSDNGIAPSRRVLNAGSGLRVAGLMPAPFHTEDWLEVTLDVDPTVRPDHVASLTDMRGVLDDGSFDAVWSSHSLEHLYGFEVIEALREFRRILNPRGFVLVTCPDVESVAAAVLEHGLDHVAYVAPAGPITVHDMLYGHTGSIVGGSIAMAHRTGLTAKRLGELAIEAGFADVAVGRGHAYDLWGVLAMPDADHEALAAILAPTRAGFLYAEGDGGNAG